MKMKKACIYCRVLAAEGRNLLSYQESILKKLANNSEMKVISIIKEIGLGQNFTSYDMQSLIRLIRDEEITHILTYSMKRISVFDDLAEEFEMICGKHNVEIVTIK